MKTYIALIGTVLIIHLFSSTLFAQDKQNIEHKFYSEAFQKERRVRVFLPERYFKDTTQQFIVTYILDAQSDALWEMAKGNIGYMVRNYSVIPMIAIGIVSDNRGDEFDPDETTLNKHLREEVFPLIENTYRVRHFDL